MCVRRIYRLLPSIDQRCSTCYHALLLSYRDNRGTASNQREYLPFAEDDYVEEVPPNRLFKRIVI